jgi:hypothetical protein
MLKQRIYVPMARKRMRKRRGNTEARDQPVNRCRTLLKHILGCWVGCFLCQQPASTLMAAELETCVRYKYARTALRRNTLFPIQHSQSSTEATQTHTQQANTPASAL